MNHRLHVLTLALTACITGACLDRELKPLNPCLVSGVTQQVKIQNIDKVDLLFMVDNSGSMAGEQASLRAQFPNVIRVLTTGERTPGDPNKFPPIKDLHVGVVSSDMGIPGVELDTCHANGGDDGRLQHTPHGDNCDATYPPFLSFDAHAMNDPLKFANDVGCIAALGTGGCGFEEQLEAPLKALWPSIFVDASGNVVTPNPIRFLATTPEGQLGHGDVDPRLGGNLGFLRNDPARGLSLIAIVVVTDEEDCSVKTTEHLWPTALLPADSPYKSEVDVNLRCFNHPELSYAIDRYYSGFRALRQGQEDLVVFAAIVGVPVDTVDKAALARVDWKNDASRKQFYDNILNDSRMQEVVDPSSHPGSGGGNLTPSCARAIPGETEPSTAFPPRRIVQLAERFGQNAIVQSICQNDFGPAMEAIIDVIASKINDVCLPRPLVRRANGTVGCNVVWELPKQALPGSGAPTACDQASYLSPVTTGRRGAGGGALCNVQQLPVMDRSTAAAPSGDGWYYDDYSSTLDDVCKLGKHQRVAFTASATPPTGVTVKLECLNETQHFADTRSDVASSSPQPEIGSACGGDAPGSVHGDDACVVTRTDGSPDKRMFCHPESQVCVRACVSDTDCPPAWVCDMRLISASVPYCVNPTCGADTE